MEVVGSFGGEAKRRRRKIRQEKHVYDGSRWLPFSHGQSLTIMQVHHEAFPSTTEMRLLEGGRLELSVFK